MAIDPVCKMEVGENLGKPSLIYNGENYVFCSVGCLAEFRRRPDDYEFRLAAKPSSCCSKPEEGDIDV